MPETTRRDFIDAWADACATTILVADGFDDALVGIVEQFGRPPIAAYDYNLCIRLLMAQDMDETEAIEYFEHNVIGAYVGESTPAFIHLCPVLTPKPQCGTDSSARSAPAKTLNGRG